MKVALVNNGTNEAKKAQQQLEKSLKTFSLDDAEVIVALGGDGFMLQTLHDQMHKPVKIFGINKGTVGFLMNEDQPINLIERIEQAEEITLHPLRMTATDNLGNIHNGLAINEVSLLRQGRQAAKIRIEIDGKTRMNELSCDGVLVATPAGSTAYNLSAHGPIIPLGSQLLALTPISAFRPRRWRGALLPHVAKITFQILNPDKRPVSAVADNKEVRDVHSVSICEDRSISLKLLFDSGHDLAERILMEQFTS